VFDKFVGGLVRRLAATDRPERAPVDWDCDLGLQAAGGLGGALGI
jgi:hypothetical protein